MFQLAIGDIVAVDDGEGGARPIEYFHGWHPSEDELERGIAWMNDVDFTELNIEEGDGAHPMVFGGGEGPDRGPPRAFDALGSDSTDWKESGEAGVAGLGGQGVPTLENSPRRSNGVRTGERDALFSVREGSGA